MKKLIMALVLMPLMVLANNSFTCSVSVDDATAGSVVRKGTASWKNIGSAGLGAPYVRVSAGEGVRLRLTDADAWGKAIEFLAVSSTSPVSSLKANESGSMTFFCQTDSDDGALELSWTTESDEQFPWSDIGASLKPSHVSNDAWAFALSTLKVRLGTTWNSYLNRLRSNMDYLAENGRAVNRVDRLLLIEINHALGVDSVLPVLASVTDASRSARGLGLSFTRSYSSSMYGRFTKGILGYGWTDNLSTYAELTDAATLVFRVPGGGSYSFTKLNGAWTPEDPRDKTVLTETTSAYKLSCQNGVVMTFAKSNMRTSSIADSSGNALTFTWNGTTLKKVTHTDGHSLSFAYSGGLLVSVTDDCGRKTQYSYSSSLLASVTSSDGCVTKYEYRPADSTAAARALSRIIYPDGTTREFSYDTSSGLVSAISVNDGKERTAIVRDGLQTTVTGPDGAETVITTGVSGEVLETVDALGGVSAQRYTADGLLASIISPSGLEGMIAYDAQGRVSKSVSPAGHETAFGYEDTFGNLTAVTDAKKHAVTYGYDAKGRGTSVAFADGSASKIEYNDRGDVVRTTNRRGQTVDYAYDARGRVTKKTWSTGRAFTYAYDTHDNVTEASDSETGTVTMEYDAADRLTRIVYPKGRGFTFAYDTAGRLVRRTSLDGVIERFAYDTAGRLASVSGGNGTVYLRNTYDATTGRLARQENGNGTSVAYLYDKLGRVVSIEHSDASGKIAESLQYCYDADGRCLRASSLQGEERYTYDKDGQLTAVDYPDIPDETFAYDAVGNRTSANGETYTANALNQYTAVSDGRTFSYDKDGNLTKMTDASGTTTYAYDTLNRLTAVKNATAGIDWSCQYDVFGNRTSVTDHGVTTERVYLQGSLPSVAAEYVNGKLSSRHILVGAVKVASETDDGQSRYYHADLIGSTRLVTDGDGAIVDRRAYTAFGESRLGERNDAAAGYVGTLGVETDSTGLLFMRNRYYSPALGRFIQMDPIGLDGGDENWYRYCKNSPIALVDVIGLMSENDIGEYGRNVMGVGGDMLVDAAIDNSFNYLAVKHVDQLYSGNNVNNVIQHARAMGGGGIQLTGSQLRNVEKIHGGYKVGGAALGAVFSGLDIYQEAVAGNPEGVKRATLEGISSIVLGKYWLLYKAAEIASYGLTMSILELNKKFKQNKTVVVSLKNRASGDDPTPGPSGGGSITSLTDWVKISSSQSGESATYSIDADITIDFNADGTVVNRDGNKASLGLSYLSDFSGRLNGNGHKIKIVGTNMIIDGYTKKSFLFWRANGATFENVTFEGCAVQNANNCTFKNCRFTDYSLVADATSCTFESCQGQADMAWLSGLFQVGALAQSAKSCTFTNCQVGGVVKGADNTGALVGDAEGCSFTSCSVDADVSGDDEVGGLVGWAENCDFMNSVAQEAVSGKGEVGGIVGYSKNCNYSNCIAKGAVTGSHSVGGFAGDLRGGNVAQCSAMGAVACDAALGGTLDDIGGFAGHIIENATVEKCLAKGGVSAAGATTVGGFAGCISDASVQKCQASGAVVGGGTVGGFVGTLLPGKTYNCCATGTVAAKGKSSLANAGGFVAMANSSTGTDCRYCYAAGKVTASGGDPMTTVAGGFLPLGVPDSTAAAMESFLSILMNDSVSCYWNSTSTGCKYSGMGTGLTSTQAKNQASYSGWDFSSIWKMGSNGPELRNVGATISTPVMSVKMSVSSEPKMSPIPSVTSSERLMTAALFSMTSGPTSPRLYCYERYVMVKGVPYSFAISADGDSAVSVSGLPTGFTFANGQIKGTATAVGESEVEITVGGTRKDIPFVVIDAPEKFAALRYFRVVFDGNGGKVSENVREIMNNAKVGDLPAPTREGYDFVGWFTTKDGGTKISATTKVTTDVVYYAHWTAKPISAYPELTSVSLNKSQLGISEILSVSYKIANPSSSADSLEDNLDVYVDGALTIGRRIEKIGDEGWRSSSIYVYAATMGPGTHTVLVKLRNGKGSFSNSVTVVNDKTADSRMDWTFHKLKSSEPDSFYLGGSLKDMTGRTSFTVGQSIYVEVHLWNAKKVRNLDPVYVQLDLSTGASMYVWWNSMNPGVTGYMTDDVRMPAMLQNLPAGNYTLTATIDPYNNWWETDENNNVKRINFTVVAVSAPDAPARSESCYLYDESQVSVAVGKGEVAPYAVGATVYDGYIVQGGVVKGTIQVKVAKGKVDKKTGVFSAKATATVQLADGSKKITFKNGVADEYGKVTGLTAAGHTLDITLGVDGLGGMFDGMSIDGARNVYSAKDKETKDLVAAIEKQWVGAVNVVGDGIALAVSIAKKGKVKVAGTVNGTKVTATSQLLVGEEACCVPVIITKKANLAFNIWLMDDGSIELAGLEGVVAGKAGTLKSGAKLRIPDGGVAVVSALPGLLDEYLPDGLSVSQSGTKWAVAGGAKAGKIVLMKGSTEVDEAKSKFTDNMSGLKLTYKAKNGSFTGSFKAYAVEKGKLKTYTLNVTGVMIGSVGYGTATLKKPAVSFPITIE